MILLRSKLTVHVPKYRLATVDRRSFLVAASILWNSLPPDIQSDPLWPISFIDYRHTCSTNHFQTFKASPFRILNSLPWTL